MATEYAVDDLNYVDSVPVMALGTVVKASDGNDYEYVLNDGDTDLPAYHLVILETMTMINGKVVQAGANTGLEHGVCHTAIGTDEYGFICVRGLHTALLAEDPSSGSLLIAKGTGVLEMHADVAATHDALAGKFVGYVTASDTSASGAALVRIL